MTVITVDRLQEAKEKISKGMNCDSVSLEGALLLTAEAVEWLKKEHYQIKVVETFGPTGVAVAIYQA